MPKRTVIKTGITEAHIQQAVVQILELDGWRSIRTDPVSDRSRGKGFGEIGMADYLFIRYSAFNGTRTMTETFWIEFKAPGKGVIPGGKQDIWHATERKRGAIVLVINDVDQFRTWYKQSGLMRRQILT